MANIQQYATPAELATFLGDAYPMPADPDRVLQRASEVVAEASRFQSETVWHVVDVDNPADKYTDALRDAACAQVEFWLEFGEEHDVVGLQGSVGLSKLQISELPGLIGPRAWRFLKQVGLASAMVGVAP